MVYPALLPLMRTPRLPVVDWTDAPSDLNGLVRFAERRNLVSARVPSHFNWPLTPWSLKNGITDGVLLCACANTLTFLSFGCWLWLHSQTMSFIWIYKNVSCVRRVYNLWVTHPRRAQISTRIYSVFRHTKHNYGPTETNVGLSTGHCHTCTH